MAKKKTVAKKSTKRSKDQKTVIVIKTLHPAKDTLFPEKLAKAGAILKTLERSNFNVPHPSFGGFFRHLSI